MNATPHTLADQLQAALAKTKALEQDVLMERTGRLLAEKRLAELGQGGPRYARNVPDPWAPGGAGHEHP